MNEWIGSSRGARLDIFNFGDPDPAWLIPIFGPPHVLAPPFARFSFTPPASPRLELASNIAAKFRR